jgi:predicted nucleic acid-binding protein
VSSYLLDTNVISELVKPKPEPAVLAFLRRQADLWLSVITLHELAYGAERARDPARRAKLFAWIAAIGARFERRILTMERDVAEQAGRLRALAEAQGRAADPLDALIAAAALSRGLTLVTRNTEDFDVFGITLLNPWKSADPA